MHEPPLFGDFAAYALFMDFDGTLVDIAPEPRLAQMPSGIADLIVRLHDRLGGALAIITGREIEVIDAFFQPHILPVAGIHGLMRRDAAGILHEAGNAGLLNDDVVAEIAGQLNVEPGVLVEPKRGAAAIHYRGAPHAASLCETAVRAVAARYPGLQVMAGKMVFELKPANRTKGTAIRSFMAEPPFASRRPVFIGDDTTDEEGFEAVNELGGVSVKVGEGESAASFRFASPQRVGVWLGRLATDGGREGRE